MGARGSHVHPSTPAPGKAPLSTLVIKNRVLCGPSLLLSLPFGLSCCSFLPAAHGGGAVLGCQASDTSKGLTWAWGYWPSSLPCLSCRQSGAWHPGPPSLQLPTRQQTAEPAKTPTVIATNGDGAQEAWSAVACGLRNVLAPARLHLRGERNLTKQSGFCLHSV